MSIILYALIIPKNYLSTETIKLSQKKKLDTLKFLESIIRRIKPIFFFYFTPRHYFPDKSYICLLRQTIDLFRRKNQKEKIKIDRN